MREIKFRAWDRMGKIMYQSKDLVKFPLEELNSISGFLFMQYTGLKDKNGKEIYEYDIIEIQCVPKLKKYIIWDKDHALFRFCGNCAFLFEQGYMSWFEIIGNIYEHPNLLKKVK